MGFKRSSFLSNWKCMLACFLVSMGPFQYGIDGGMIGGLQAMIGFLQVFGYADPLSPIGWNINPTVQQLISSLMILGACIGCLAAGPFGARIGRRPSLWFACGLCIVADIIMMTTTNIGAMYAGRLIIGLANGLFMTFSQMYIQECAPAHLRGVAMGFFQWWCTFGGLIGTIVDNFTETIEGRACYLIPLGLIYVVPVIMTFGMFLIPESPRWLVEHGDMDAARTSLYWHRPDKDAVEAELAEIKQASQAEREAASAHLLVDMFRDPVQRRRTILSIMAICINGATGSMFMIAYGTYFFEMAGITAAFQDSCILTAVGLIAITISFFIIMRVGRRPLLITGVIICGFCNLISAAVYQSAPGTINTGRVIVAMSAVFLFFCSGCIVPYAWLVGGEIPSQRLRSVTIGLASCVGFFEGWLIAFTTPYYINPDQLNWGAKYGYIWFGSSMITATVLYIFLPETKDRTLEELDGLFTARLPARKFASYVCTNTSLKPEAAGEETPSDEKGGSVEYIEHVEQRA